MAAYTGVVSNSILSGILLRRNLSLNSSPLQASLSLFPLLGLALFSISNYIFVIALSITINNGVNIMTYSTSEVATSNFEGSLTPYLSS